MGAFTYDTEIPSSIPAAKMLKAILLDADTLIPKIMPHAVEKVEVIEGNGDVGTVKIIHFGEGSRYKSAKLRFDAIDRENLTHSYSVVEGDVLMGAVESITNFHVEFVPMGEGGCICRSRSVYHTKGDAEISEEKIKEGKEKAVAMFKAIEGYLQANPDA